MPGRRKRLQWQARSSGGTIGRSRLARPARAFGVIAPDDEPVRPARDLGEAPAEGAIGPERPQALDEEIEQGVFTARHIDEFSGAGGGSGERPHGRAEFGGGEPDGAADDRPGQMRQGLERDAGAERMGEDVGPRAGAEPVDGLHLPGQRPAGAGGLAIGAPDGALRLPAEGDAEAFARVGPVEAELTRPGQRLPAAVNVLEREDMGVVALARGAGRKAIAVDQHDDRGALGLRGQRGRQGRLAALAAGPAAVRVDS